MQIPDNTPVIIGAGQHVERITTDQGPQFSSPMQLAAAACQKALQDAGAGAAGIDTIGVIKLFSDAAPAWRSPFGGSNNPPASVARLIGASPDHRIYSNAGGTQPLQLMVEMFQAIARGEKQLVMLTGAEAIANQRFALRNAYEADWNEDFDLPLDNREYTQRFASPQELQSGMSLPVHYYALIENLHALRMGHDLQQHRRHMANLMAPFSAVAAANPYSQFDTVYTPEELACVDERNYEISLPYCKRFIAQDAVNQSCALLLSSAGHARALGIDPGQWTLLEAYAEGQDRYLSEREDPGSSEAMARVLTATMDMAGASATDMDLIDIYSCFPCAVQSVCDVLDLPSDGSGQLTVTGGLPYFGGPGNNYSMHALAEMAVRLRGTAGRGLVTANGGILSKHAAAVLAPTAEQAASVDWGQHEVLNVEPASIPARPYNDSPECGQVISYTVITNRDKEDIGVVLAETDAGERFLASSTAPAVTTSMVQQNPIGRRIAVSNKEQRQIFEFLQH